MSNEIFAPIIEAFADVRTRVAPRARQLTARIYDGDRAALDEAEQIMRRSGEMVDQLQRVIEASPVPPSSIDTELDLVVVQRLVGIYEMADAVLVAYGEQPCDDDAVWERWRPLRLERRRRQLEHWIAQVDAMEQAGTLGADGDELRREARGSLALLAAPRVK